MPCVEFGKDGYLPMELCTTELKSKKKLNEKETADIIKQTAVPPAQRMQYIDTWAKRSNIEKDPILNEYNIKLELKMIQLFGHVLEAPDIQYSGTKSVPSKIIGETGAWDHRNFIFNSPIVVKNWVLVNLDNRTRPDTVDRFIDNLLRGI